MLIKNKANIESETFSAWTSLLIAASTNDLIAMNYLIKMGANINVQSKIGITPIIAAIEHNHIDAIKLLLTAGADIHKKTTQGGTASHAACCHGSVELIKIFVEYGSNISMKFQDQTLLMLATECGHKEVVEYLLTLKNIDINSCDKNGWNILYYLIERNYFDIFKQLVQMNVDVNVTTDTKWTLLMIACKNDINNEFIDLLLNKMNHKTIHMIDQDGWNSLAISSMLGYVKIVEILLQAKLEMNVCFDSTDLFSAMKKSVHKRLLKYKCQNDKKCPLLINVVIFGQIEVVKLLVKYGIDLQLKNTAGYYAMTIAKNSLSGNLRKDMIAALQFNK